MKPLRAAAFVMLAVAAMDGALELIEYLTLASVWQVMALTGLAVLVIDLVIDRRTVLGRPCHEAAEWIGDRFRGFLRWSATSTFGSGRFGDPDQ